MFSDIKDDKKENAISGFFTCMREGCQDYPAIVKISSETASERSYFFGHILVFVHILLRTDVSILSWRKIQRKIYTWHLSTETDVDQIIKATQCYKSHKSLPEKNKSQEWLSEVDMFDVRMSPELRFKQNKTKQ